MLAVLALVLLGLLVGVRSTPTTKTTDRHYQATNLNTQTHLWLQSDLAEAKRRIAVGELQSAFKGLEDAAIQTLDAIEWTILNKTLVPASKDMRDYVSIAIYNWPCNATPPGCKDYPGSVWPPCNETTALPWRACDGCECWRFTSRLCRPISCYNIGADICAYRYMLASPGHKSTCLCMLPCNQTYADKACTLLDRWFLDLETSMNPNLKYGQGTPGVDEGSHGGMIEWTNIVETIDAAVVLQNSACWTSTMANTFQTWVSDMLNFIWNTGASEMNGERYMPNNHGTWYDSTVLSLALGSQADDVGQQIVGNVTKLRVDSQIDPDGRMPEETGRNNGASYSIYNMQAFTNVAALAEWFGFKLWEYESSDGRSIRKALDYLIPFALFQAPWPFSQATEQLDFTGLVQPLRYASYALNNRTYEVVACRIFNNTQAYLENKINLIKPPLFNISATECVALPPSPQSSKFSQNAPFYMK
eukprot:m.134579 g.134579  ORF g.134579 m.134579 type:complete len:475 (-) comp15824_c0_seq13:2391-3815(-)